MNTTMNTAMNTAFCCGPYGHGGALRPCARSRLAVEASMAQAVLRMASLRWCQSRQDLASLLGNTLDDVTGMLYPLD
jgi:hypothetical protein